MTILTRDEDRRVETSEFHAVAADLREAYERGRRDERAARRRHPIGMTLLFLSAAVGVIVLALAAVNGSFGVAGQAVDAGLTAATTHSAG